MSLVENLGPHLPYLRRFARAVTGNQKDGDLYVRTALEALVAGQVDLDDDLPPKIALFRMFLGIWNSTGAKFEATSDDNDPLAKRLSAITPRNRQAFLLNAMEDMSEKDIAIVLDVSPDEANLLLSEAENEIESELRTNVLIIEDEPIIAADIEGLVEELGHEVDGIAATHSAAIAAVNRKVPGIILADVQLADGSSGIDAVNEVLKTHDLPVIFITAFPERLLTGDKPEPAYLISKPFRPANVKAAISQALFFHQSV